MAHRCSSKAKWQQNALLSLFIINSLCLKRCNPSPQPNKQVAWEMYITSNRTIQQIPKFHLLKMTLMTQALQSKFCPRNRTQSLCTLCRVFSSGKHEETCSIVWSSRLVHSPSEPRWPCPPRICVASKSQSLNREIVPAISDLVEPNESSHRPIFPPLYPVPPAVVSVSAWSSVSPVRQTAWK